MRSLRTRLIVWVAASAIVLTAVAGVSLYMLARTYLLGQFDAALVGKARLLSSTIRTEFQVLEMEFEDLDMSEFASAEAGRYFQVWFEGKTVYRSPSLGESNLRVGEASADVSAVRWVELPEGRLGRGVVYRFVPAKEFEDGRSAGESAEATIFVARDVAEVAEALRALQVGLVGIGVVLAVVMSGVIAYGVSRGLRPVKTLTTQLSQLDERSLGKRIDPPRLPEELQPIVEQFNGLMERLRLAFERERTFSASIAHELRTPLAGLMTTIEVALARPRSSEEYADCLGRLLDVTKQTRTMIESLLQLAALENGKGKGLQGSVRLREAIGGAWDVVAADGSAAGRKYELRRSGDADVMVATDPALLGVVLRNVIHNAVTYVNDGGTIAIGWAVLDGAVEIRVSNSGSRVSASEAGKVFDRFWRADKARSETGTRFGLGLSIVRLAVDALGGSVRAESVEGGDFTIVLQLATH